MTVSRDEAVGLLRKWASESIQVFVFMHGDGFVLRLIGSISVFDPPTFLVAQKGEELRRTDIAVGLSGASDFDYSDLREAPEPVKAVLGDWLVSGLTFSLPNATVRVYELRDTTASVIEP